MNLTLIFISIFFMLLTVLIFIFTSISTMNEVPKSFIDKESKASKK